MINNNFIVSRLKYVYLFIFALLSLVVIGGITPAKASASSLWPPGGPAGAMPSGLYNLESNCNQTWANPTLWSPFVGEWISPAGAPTSTSITVPYGTSSINLQFNHNAVNCVYNSGQAIYTTERINDSWTPGVSGVSGAITTLNLGVATPIGTAAQTQAPFTYAPPGGFTSSGSYSVELNTQGTNQFNRGYNQWQCITSSPTPIYTSSLYNYSPCPFLSIGYPIYVNVLPPPPNMVCDGTSAPSTITMGSSGTITMSLQNIGGSPGTPENFALVYSTTGYTPGPYASDYTTSFGAPPGGGVFTTSTVFTPPAVGTYYFLYAAQPNQVFPCVFSITVNPPPPAFQCDGLSVNTALPETGVPFTVTMNAKNVVPYSSATFPPSTFNWTATGPGGFSAGGSASPPGTFVYGGPDASVTYTVAAPLTGTYTFKWTVNPPSGPMPCSGTVVTHVVARPYARVYGADVVAGSEFTSSSGTCTAPSGSKAPQAGIIGWEGSSAGTSTAAEAMAEIIGFNSNYVGSSSPFSNLIFANNTPEIQSAPYYKMGGNFGSVPCVPDYSASGATTPWTSASWGTSGNYTYTGPGTLVLAPSGAIGIGKHITIYVSGSANVEIKNNITYQTTGWTKPSDIPSFKLVVQDGNINIDGPVTYLEGAYIAQPYVGGPTPTQGVISTCADPSTGMPQANNASYYSNCSNQLFIGGSFVAREVQFMRAYKGLRGDGSETQTCSTTSYSSTAAEVFVDGPQDWLGSLGKGSTPNQNYYQSLTDLPPIL